MYRVHDVKPCADHDHITIYGTHSIKSLSTLQGALEYQGFFVRIISSLGSIAARKGQIMFTSNKDLEFIISYLDTHSEGLAVLNEIESFVRGLG